jgi:cbb3-type cytochrome oxidase maturation protein
MSVIFLMIPISLLLSLGFVAAFIWSTKKGQFDHIDLESQKILNDKD